MRRETTIDDDAVVGEARMLGAAVITVTLVLIVLNTIMSLGIIAGETSTVTNESITVDYGNLTYVSQSADSYDSNVTVYDSGDVELTEGTDYDWYANNGSVGWYNTTETTDGETATITYSYTTGGATGPLASVISDVVSLSGAAFAILIVGFVVLAANAVLNYFGRGL